MRLPAWSAFAVVIVGLTATACPRLALERVDNAEPVVAIADEDARQTVDAGATIVLVASATDDDDGADNLTFSWTQLSTDPIQVPIVDAKKPTASAVAPPVGATLNFLVTASDGIEVSAPGLVTVTVVVPDNARPVATGVSETLTALVGDEVVLDGTPSADPANEALTFSWNQLQNEQATPVNLRDAATSVASFTAPETDGPLFFQLVVSDPVGNTSEPFVVRVVIDARTNLPPTVVLADDVIDANAGATVVLNAAASTDPEGAPLSFRWEQVLTGSEAPVNVLTPLSSSASFTAPDETTRLFFRVFVSDGVNEAPPAVVQVDVFVPPNIQPAARVANPERSAVFGTTVVLDGGLSADADNDPLTFRWTQVAGNVAIAGLPATTSSFTFSAPAEETRLVFELTVNDGLIDSVPAVVIVDVTPPPNARPVARMVDGGGALIDRLQVQGDANVALDGGGSSDGDGDTLAFRWQRLDNGVPVNLSPASGEAAVVTFRAPDITTTMFFSLIVNDGREDSVPHVVRVEITQRDNQSPTVDLSKAAQVVNAEATVILDARASTDPEGRPLSFRWTQVDDTDTPVNIIAATTSVASFTAPDENAELIFRLTVSDGVNTAIGIFTVSVVQDVFNLLPLVTPIADLVVVPTGQSVQLRCGQGVNTPGDGEDETDDCRDADGTIASFKWSLQSGPAGGTAVFSPPQANIREPSVRLTGRGTYFLALVATDDRNDTSLPQLVRIDVINSAPVAQAPAPDTTQNGAAVTLVGGGTDSDGDVISFRWSLIDNPDGGRVALVGANTAAVSFTPTKKTPVSDPTACVEGGGCYQLQLVVSDGREDSAPVKVFVAVTDREPVGNAGQDNDGDEGDIVLDGRFSFDPDGDAITDFTWVQTLGPDLGPGSTPGIFSGDVVRIVAPAQALYVFQLVVTAAGVDSPPDEVQISIDNINSVPVLSSPQARFVVGEGTPATFAVQVSDLDDAIHEVEWTKTAGNALFPQTLIGKTPNLIGPPYLPLLASAEGSSATYSVVARDPSGALSNEIAVEIFAGPGLGQFVVLNIGPGSSTSPTCGSVAEPCATLAAAIAVVDPDANTIGDGRDFIFTSGIFTATQARIPAGTSLLGGRSPVTFTLEGESVLLHDAGAMTQASFLLFGNNAQDAVIENLTVRFQRPTADGTRQTIQCDACTLTIRDSVIVSEGAINHAAIRASGASTLFAERVRVEIRGVRDNQEAFELSGSSHTIIDSDVFVSAANGFGRNNPITMNAGTAEVERNRLIITGEFMFNDTNVIRVNGGVMRARNNFMFVGTPGDGAAISHASGSGSYFNNTLIGNTGARADAGAVETTVPLALMNNHMAGFSEGIRLTSGGARSSTLYGNVLDNTGAEIECPNAAGTGNTVNTDNLNAAPTTVDAVTCNSTLTPWASNQVATCPLVDAQAADLHLNGALTNPCRDGGLTSSPAGVAPTDDLDGQSRVAPFDVGADEL